MSTEENKAVPRRWLEIFNEGKLDVIDEILDKDYYNSLLNVRGLESVRQFVIAYRTSFPDIKFTVEDQIAEGDKVTTRFSATGTHRGEFMGVAPTGKTVKIATLTVYRIVNGKIVEGWSIMDNLGTLQQLGATSLPEKK
ncbi:Aklanonic acid methyl ester cyclase AcmA [subsurface metagenome]